MVKLYHGTSLTAVESLVADGKLIPNKLNSSNAIANGYDSKEYYGYLFLTDDLSNAIHYSTMAIANNHKSAYHHRTWGNLTVVLEIELPGQQLLPDFHDAPESKSWEESLEYCQAVRHHGEIPASSITRILYCHYEYDTAIATAPFSHWKEALEDYGYLFDTEHEELVGQWIEEEKTPLIYSNQS